MKKFFNDIITVLFIRDEIASSISVARFYWAGVMGSGSDQLFSPWKQEKEQILVSVSLLPVTGPRTAMIAISEKRMASVEWEIISCLMVPGIADIQVRLDAVLEAVLPIVSPPDFNYYADEGEWLLNQYSGISARIYPPSPCPLWTLNITVTLLRKRRAKRHNSFTGR